MAGSPKTNDGKLIVMISPSSEGLKTWFTGAGDELDPISRGTGTRLLLSWSNDESRGQKSVDIQFSEPVEVHDGQAVMSGSWSPDDYIDLSAIIPSTETMPNVSGTGDVNRVPTGLGYDVIVRAAGDGAYDLTNGVPVEAPSGDGYWDVEPLTGEITPGAIPGGSRYHMLSIPLEVFFLRRIPLGQGHGVLDVDVYKTEWIHQNWFVRMAVTKNSSDAGTLGGWLLTFRKNVT